MTKIYVGADIGHAQTKIVGSSPTAPKARTLPQIATRLQWGPIAQYPGGLEFVASPNPDWHGLSVLPSDGSTGRKPSPTDLDWGKPKFALPMLLWQLWPHLTQSEPTEVHVYTSVHLSTASWHMALMESLRGTHQLRRTEKGRVVEKVVEIRPGRCLQEGQGALAWAAQNRITASTIWALDLGGGTTIGTLFEGLRPASVCRPHVASGNGVHRLLAELRKEIACVADMPALPTTAQVDAILRGQLPTIGWASEQDLAKAVQNTVEAWFESLLLDLEDTEAEISRASRKVAFGGGCLIPQLQTLLVDAGYEVLPNPAYANALGLHGLCAAAVREVAA